MVKGTYSLYAYHIGGGLAVLLPRPWSGVGWHQALHKGCLPHVQILSQSQLCGDPQSRLNTRSEVLEELDLSWCRGVSGPAVGLLADSCPNLRKLRLFGCSQVHSWD